MNLSEKVTKENQEIRERYELAIQRITEVVTEETMSEKYKPYFMCTAKFILLIEQVREDLESGVWESKSPEEKQDMNQKLYADVIGEAYETSFANPKVACEAFGEKVGQLLSVLYTEIRGEIAYVFELNLSYLTICNELFIQIYNCFENEEEIENCHEIFYWYASDYCDVFLADRIIEQVDTSYSFARNIIETSDLYDVSYLYDFGEYVSETEIKTARYLQSIPQETIDLMASVYVDGYKNGFVKTGKDLSIKSIVDIRYVLGFELVIKRALELFDELGLKASICRAACSIMTKKQNLKVGYCGSTANQQYDYDHKDDQALILDKKFIERKLEVMKTTYEDYADMAAGYAGPAVIIVFGAEPFAPVHSEYACKLSEKQEKLSVQYDNKSGQLINHYVHGEERSFTIVGYPVPDIGDEFEKIFEEIIKINTLDGNLYEGIQDTIISALDEGEYVRIVGKGNNKTHLNIQLQKLNNPVTDTGFGNCVADVNIPVGEVFTSPMLEGTFGTLHVTKVFLRGLQYENLEFQLEDGMVTDYSCTNFTTDEANKKYIKESIMNNHNTLPIGEFAIGTNTTAYVVARKYGIEDKMPILIAEKTGPHFALGDTCYSWSEDVKSMNPNGKEVTSKDNAISILRREDVSKAYVNCHTDITIPYEELQEITVVKPDGSEIKIIENERFVLSGTEALNEPFDM